MLASVVVAGCGGGSDGAEPGGHGPTTRNSGRSSVPAGVRIDTGTVRERSPKPPYEVAVRFPQLDGGDAAVVAPLNRAVRDAVDKAVADFRAEAADLGSAPEAGAPPFGLDGDYEVVHRDPRYVSLRQVLARYVGGAHPSNEVRTWNLDLRVGRVVQLAELFRPGSGWLERVAELSQQALADALGPDGDPEWIARGAGPEVANFAAWTLGDGGLDITFQEYQVAAYALGTPRITIPAADLIGLLVPGGPLDSLPRRR